METALLKCRNGCITPAFTINLTSGMSLLVESPRTEWTGDMSHQVIKCSSEQTRRLNDDRKKRLYFQGVTHSWQVRSSVITFTHNDIFNETEWICICINLFIQRHNLYICSWLHKTFLRNSFVKILYIETPPIIVFSNHNLAWIKGHNISNNCSPFQQSNSGRWRLVQLVRKRIRMIIENGNNVCIFRIKLSV